MKTVCVLLLWASAASSAWCAAAAPIQAAKVVRQYALTSANDFSERDPQDWRLLASNDGGKTWMTLDVRKGEAFPERQQRRVFALTNHAAFNLYRLQIERVRDPAGANAVQLAEIEAMGEMQNDLDPTPTFADVITAQGENSPSETAIRAFDGLAETKWLDFAEQNPGSRASWIQWQYAPVSSLVVTNLEQLFTLRSHANRGYEARIEGVLAGRLPGTNLLYFVDGTGSLGIQDAVAAEPFFPGQRVLLEGTSQWTNEQAGIRQPRLERRGPKAAAEPRLIGLEQPLAPGQNWEWVEVEGRIGFCAQAGARVTIELEEGEHSVSVQVLQAISAQRQPLPAGRVRVRGICEAVLDGRGGRVAGRLWVPSLDDIVPVATTGPANGTAGGPPAPLTKAQGLPLLTDIGAIRRLGREELASGPRVRIRGVVLFDGFIQEGSAGIEVFRGGSTLEFSRGVLGDYVELEGTAIWAARHGLVVRAERVEYLGKGKLPQPGRPTWTQLAAGKMFKQWIELDGVVRATDGSHVLLTCEGGQLMATVRYAAVREVERLVDAAVSIRGVCIAATDDREQVQGIQLLVPSLEFVEVKQEPMKPFSLPVRPIGSLLQVKSPQDSAHRARIEGVLTCQDGRKYFLQDGTGSAMAIHKEEVMLKTPSALWHWVFWQSPSTNIPPKSQVDLKIGDKVQVVGFPERGGEAPVLTEALVRKVGEAEPVHPAEATLEDILLGRHDSALVRLEGRVLGRETVGQDLVLELQSGKTVFQAVLRGNSGVVPGLATASRLRVTGVCQIDPSPYAELGKRVGTFKLLLRSAGDIAILERQPWWTAKHALSVVGTLGLVLLVAMGWIRTLRRRVEEKTRQLRQEVADHEKTEERLADETKLLQREIEERRCTETSLASKTELLEKEIEKGKTAQAEVEKVHRQLLSASRLAGMADVATSVLHNVGNVLNSVNVLTASIATSVQRSKVPGVSRVAQLLDEHQPELGRFITQDENGKHVPGLLRRLGTHLLEEHQRLLEKTASLTDSIQHIKEIVAMQQNYARVAGVRETLPITEVVENALAMCSGALARHEVEVIKDFEELAPVTLDRHKVLQILFNLLDNARYACGARPDVAGRVIIRIRQLEGGRIRLQVIDNGIGIPKENLSRIFTQGFSTRKGGHGFGLHSSILAAQDMGGSLTVQSEGAGAGATFALELTALAEEPGTKPRIEAGTAA